MSAVAAHHQRPTWFTKNTQKQLQYPLGVRPLQAGLYKACVEKSLCETERLIEIHKDSPRCYSGGMEMGVEDGAGQYPRRTCLGRPEKYGCGHPKDKSTENG